MLKASHGLPLTPGLERSRDKERLVERERLPGHYRRGWGEHRLHIMNCGLGLQDEPFVLLCMLLGRGGGPVISRGKRLLFLGSPGPKS